MTGQSQDSWIITWLTLKARWRHIQLYDYTQPRHVVLPDDGLEKVQHFYDTSPCTHTNTHARNYICKFFSQLCFATILRNDTPCVSTPFLCRPTYSHAPLEQKPCLKRKQNFSFKSVPVPPFRLLMHHECFRHILL